MLLRRVKVIDSLFNSVKTGRKIATNGPDRTRIVSKDAYTALAGLALLSTTALALADQRQRRGISPTPPAPRPAPAIIAQPTRKAMPAAAPAAAPEKSAEPVVATAADQLLYG